MEVKKTQTTEIAKESNDFSELSLQVANVHKQNKESVEKASKAMKAFWDKLKDAEMSEEIDLKAKTLLEKVKKTVPTIRERRKPVTQLMDQVKKEFTGLEKQISPENEFFALIQKKRDDWAALKVKQQREKEEAERIALEKDKEIAYVKEQVELQINEFFNKKVEGALSMISDHLKQLNLQNKEAIETGINAYSSDYTQEHFDSFKANRVATKHLSLEEKRDCKAEVLKGKYEKFKEQFKFEVCEFKLDALEKIPERIQELEALAKSEKENKEAAEKLKKELAEKRKKEEAENKKKEEERKSKAEAEAKRKKAEAEMQASLKASISTTDTASVEASVKKTLEIEMKSVAGFAQIYQFYFENEGKNLTVEQFAKKTMKQMVSFAEKIANKEGEIIDSKYIEYKESIKAK